MGLTQSLSIHKDDAKSKIMGYHDVDTAARVARTLVFRESLANLNTLDVESGYPVGFVEYYADCQQDGQPLMLMIDVSSSEKNIEAGSNSSLTIRVGDHQPNDFADPHYRGMVPFSVAGAPRINLKGHLVEYDATPEDKVCFGRRHREAVSWYPSTSLHESRWVKFEIDSVYLIGGFGDRAYIGDIPVDTYLAAEPFPERKGPHRSHRGHGDHRGRGDRRNDRVHGDLKGYEDLQDLKAAISAVAIVGVASLIFRTYPHLKPLFLCCNKDSESEEDNKPLSDSTVVVDKEIEEWTDKQLKEFLKENEVIVPESATHSELVAFVQQIQK
ncbi:hypothetical protein FOA43_000929 [Brettanomyces nanus]|uniref:CREG-like beta-barrel domain-containing protein n=1 Tax=Eeniella nana TaxID=13502 RepID=A0A875RTL5_EENNA|nr:uncharacterized protein FOA43_000929 [Brettanomyces nanus]QPG73617.1 hypothetical protein FOA43_000929 [Brettanomyces nanus]